MSTTYNVITRYRIDADQARREGRALKGLFGSIGEVVQKSVFNLRTAFAGGLAGAGLLQVGRRVAGLNSQFEQAGISIATLLNVNQVYSFNDALTASQAIFTQLREDAAAGVGELEDYLGAYQQILNPSLQAGASLDQLREMNRLLVAAGFALRGQEGGQLAAFDLQQALTQGVGQRTTPIINQVLRTAGMTNEAFNRLAEPQRFQLLLEALKGFEPAVERQSQSWQGLTSTLRDSLKDLVARASQPLFQRWLQDLREANRWLASHREQVQDLADRVGRGLVRVWDRTWRFARDWRGELQAAVPIMAALAGLQIASAGGGPGLAVMGQHLLGAGARPPAPARLPSKVPFTHFGADLVGGLKGGIFSGVLGGAIGGLDKIVVGAGRLGTVLRPLARLVGRAAVPLALLTAGIEAFIGDTFGAATWLTGEAGGLLTELKVLFGSLFALFDNGFFRTAGGALLGLGGALLWGLKWIVKIINWGVVPLVGAFKILGAYFQRGVGFLLDLVKTRSATTAWARFEAGIDEDLARIVRQYRGRFAGDEEAPDLASAAPPAAALPVARTLVNIGQVTVEQKLEQNANPDRIAWAWSDMLGRVNRHARQSRALPHPVR